MRGLTRKLATLAGIAATPFVLVASSPVAGSGGAETGYVDVAVAVPMEIPTCVLFESCDHDPGRCESDTGYHDPIAPPDEELAVAFEVESSAPVILAVAQE